VSRFQGLQGFQGGDRGVTGEGKKDGEEVERRRTKMLQKMGGRARFEWKKETKKKGQLLGMESNNGTNCVQKVDEETGGREREGGREVVWVIGEEYQEEEEVETKA